PRGRSAFSRPEAPMWIYPSQGPNGIKLKVIDLAFYGERVRHTPTEGQLWVHSNMAEWIRTGAAKPERIPACVGTHEAMFYVPVSELEL
ncbi:hypothetical protein, partial [Nonomuraea zeae]|uniref:hypothetical protein n=1 Tax=Nonomuraea zeae TaxID=1642303 RepID=UPI00361445D2